MIFLIKKMKPASISYMRIPKVHQSTGFPCPLFNKISGARYSGVPQRVYVLPSKYFANPKSVSIKYPSEATRRFSGLRSLWKYWFSSRRRTVANKSISKKLALTGKRYFLNGGIQTSQPLERHRSFKVKDAQKKENKYHASSFSSFVLFLIYVKSSPPWTKSSRKYKKRSSW